MNSSQSAEQQVLATGFRRLARQLDVLTDHSALGRERLASADEQRLRTEAGLLIMQAAELGLLNGLPKIDQLTKWARGKGKHPGGLDGATTRAVYARTPSNVFRDVAGYYETIVRARRHIRAGEVVRDDDPDVDVVGQRHVGVLPEWMPGAFPPNPFASRQAIAPDELGEFHRRRSGIEREAAARACLALASLVERDAGRANPPPATPRAVYNSKEVAAELKKVEWKGHAVTTIERKLSQQGDAIARELGIDPPVQTSREMMWSKAQVDAICRRLRRKPAR